jgi:succinate-acetate transporter protein
VLGLAGFALATITLQFYSIGVMNDKAPFVFSGLMFGGVAQIIAGERFELLNFKEFQTNIFVQRCNVFGDVLNVRDVVFFSSSNN